MNKNRVLIQIRNLSKNFGREMAVDSVSMDIYDQEFLVLLGPSGCGKTTLLRMLGGFENPTAGEIRMDGGDLAALPPNRRPLNMVFQSYAVFPHMNVRDNIAYGLKIDRVPRPERQRRVDEALALVQLEALATRYPHQLSGGQQQRVALARALVKRPRVLLLDEPLSALDAKLRETMQNELVKLQHAVGITFVVVTHDQDEALSMAERVAVMESGRIRQLDTPRKLYEAPQNRFVADFVGRMNILPARRTAPGRYAVDGLGEITATEISPQSAAEISPQPPAEISPQPPTEISPQSPAYIAVRPEKLSIAPIPPDNPANIHTVAARITQSSYYGGETVLTVRTTIPPGADLTLAAPNARRRPLHAPTIGDPVTLWWRPDDVIALTQ